MRDLLTLYNLLWQQIKDENNVYPLILETEFLYARSIISNQENEILDFDIENQLLTSDNRKQFVQRRIKELENRE